MIENKSRLRELGEDFKLVARQALAQIPHEKNDEAADAAEPAEYYAIK